MLARLINSLKPVRDVSQLSIPTDLYGPTMLASTLVAVLLMNIHTDTTLSVWYGMVAYGGNESNHVLLAMSFA